jgi:tetratricopeptide (TPR) repeat protein
MRAILIALSSAILCLTHSASAQSNDFTATQEALLAEAQGALDADPDDADAAVWVGRRLGYLGRYDDAVAVYRDGWRRHPDDARFPRHIGHRLISLRRFNEAAVVLQQAADLMAARPNETEPDGLPNEAGVPTSTLKGNIYYHLALAHYLQEDFARAATVWAQAAAVAANADAASASRYWLYLSRARAGDMSGAESALDPVSGDWELLENHDYHELALCFKGAADCEVLAARALSSEGVAAGTLLYGLGANALIDGDTQKANEFFDAALAAGASASFGYIAAEAE